MKTNEEMTEIFQNLLMNVGVTGYNAYEWYDGEALYCGDPIEGRANKAEQKAIRKMRDFE